MVVKSFEDQGYEKEKGERERGRRVTWACKTIYYKSDVTVNDISLTVFSSCFLISECFRLNHI